MHDPPSTHRKQASAVDQEVSFDPAICIARVPTFAAVKTESLPRSGAEDLAFLCVLDRCDMVEVGGLVGGSDSVDT